MLFQKSQANFAKKHLDVQLLKDIPKINIRSLQQLNGLFLRISSQRTPEDWDDWDGWEVGVVILTVFPSPQVARSYQATVHL